MELVQFRTIVASALTLWWVNFAWIFFRANDAKDAAILSRAYLTFQSTGTQSLPSVAWWMLIILLIVHIVSDRF